MILPNTSNRLPAKKCKSKLPKATQSPSIIIIYYHRREMTQIELVDSDREIVSRSSKPSALLATANCSSLQTHHHLPWTATKRGVSTTSLLLHDRLAWRSVNRVPNATARSAIVHAMRVRVVQCLALSLDYVTRLSVIRRL